MALKKQRLIPFEEGRPSAWDPIDDKFYDVERRMVSLQTELGEVALKVLLVTGRRMYVAALLFDQSDHDLSRLTKSLKTFHFENVKEDLRSFLQNNPYTGNVDSPEGKFIYACMLLQDALLNQDKKKHVETHRTTVSCRAALARLGIG